MKATEQYFPEVLFIAIQGGRGPNLSLMKSVIAVDVTIQIDPIEQYMNFAVVLFTLHCVVRCGSNFDSVDEKLN